ncbi:MAG: 4Fe-4S dicluster domain-containing protein [Pseudomonadales bacterium]|jgi:Pyruvate/2-oxoacid:ferredoxin oxidoreductase delta subunit|nr:4Fe-4S dicluster domain-containing protein [Pseudomonadales bacterium]MDP7594833.1 4Fe-4S dicluster domain-containing protein [Pseudomonadales bacterium]HJN51793.1 4Fe-4S dicluster domain-containing protein [Pseudomonadales bacterium]|tara:strand:+ start:3553 stop:4647 length:1095 start_codon:yes stop_codon:yes gene_type:complete
MNASESYAFLMKQLGYPKSDRFRAILENLLTPDRARIAAALPGTAEDVAEKTGLNADDIEKDLEYLFVRGAVFPRGDYAKREFFRFARSMGQFHDCTQATCVRDVDTDKEFYQLWQDFVMNEWYPDQGKSFAQAPRPSQRIVPAYSSIKDLPNILPQDDFREILKAQEHIAVVPCSCRYRTTSVDEHCEHTSEEDRWNCIQFGRSADYVDARSSGKTVTTEEALELSDQCEEDGLLHMWANHATMAGVGTSCQCCRDCCMIYIPADMAGTSIGKIWEKSRFQAVVDAEECGGCQECLDRCQFDAIEMVMPEASASGKKSKKMKAEVIADNCWGCGVCVIACETSGKEALSMFEARPPEFIPGLA